MTTLVIAIGSLTNDFVTPGVAAHAVPLGTPAQAARFNRRLVNACIRAHTQEGPVRPGQHHVAIIGGGATGTELAAELHRTPLRMIHERSLNGSLYAVLGLLSRALSRRTGPPALTARRCQDGSVKCGLDRDRLHKHPCFFRDR